MFIDWLKSKKVNSCYNLLYWRLVCVFRISLCLLKRKLSYLTRMLRSKQWEEDVHWNLRWMHSKSRDGRFTNCNLSIIGRLWVAEWRKKLGKTVLDILDMCNVGYTLLWCGRVLLELKLQGPKSWEVDQIW